eukprot:g2725.t1
MSKAQASEEDDEEEEGEVEEEVMLVKLRNPNAGGLGLDSTTDSGWHGGWTGAWSYSSTEWTWKLKKDLGLDREDDGVFYMSWHDFTYFFHNLTICRLLPDYLEARQGGWLPSIFNAGQAVALDVYAHTEVEVTAHQEAHVARYGDASIGTRVDLGVAVLKCTSSDNAGSGVVSPTSSAASAAGGGGAGVGGVWKLKEHSKRRMVSSVSVNATLEQDDYPCTRYVVLPLCFGHMRSSEPRKFTVSVHSKTPIVVDTVPVSAEEMAAAAIQVVVEKMRTTRVLTLWFVMFSSPCTQGEKIPYLHNGAGMEALVFYKLNEEEHMAGLMFVAENRMPIGGQSFLVECDATDSTGYVSSRGALFCQDVILPQQRQLIMVLSADMSRKDNHVAFRFACDPKSQVQAFGNRNIPTLEDMGALKGLHAPLPIPHDPAAAAALQAAGWGGGGGGGMMQWQQPQQPQQPAVDATALANSLALTMAMLQQEQGGQDQQGQGQQGDGQGGGGGGGGGSGGGSGGAGAGGDTAGK